MFGGWHYFGGRLLSHFEGPLTSVFPFSYLSLLILEIETSLQYCYEVFLPDSEANAGYSLHPDPTFSFARRRNGTGAFL